MSNDGSFLTFADVRGWEARVLEIDDSVRSQTEERAVLVRKIEAAKVLMEPLPMSVANEDAKDSRSDEVDEAVTAPEDSISNVILCAVSAVKAPAKAVPIRNWIAANHPTVSARLDANPAYLYTTLMRHVRAGRLTKRGKGYRVAKTSPNGEAGGVAPPVLD